ncbi:Dabb family protein [Spongiivirga citrea]|uniref:Dabb family protein n=1 Tax=Spongiivirga citrea TaxID=1481457 RepID=A0A6M0CE87_9FLAO|nr:Dabb family protein [Spongiivirga citrea]NER16125.1 Dabb family protein [Spongiivirga citrea]
MINRVKIALCLLVFIGVGSQSCAEKKEEKEISETVKEEIMPEKLLRHVVLFKFKDEAPEAAVNNLNDMFNALPAAIPEIKDFEWGINDSPENFHQDFTHCYLVTFGSEQDRDSVYSPHPKHQEFVAALQPHLEKVFVVDYWAN